MRLIVAALVAVLLVTLPASAMAATPSPDNLADWLAGQIGPTKQKPAGKKRKPKRTPGGSAAPRVTLGAVAQGAPAPEPVAFAAQASPGPLSLVRSFDLPASDPEYERLANLSWTYDNALAALAFIARGERARAETLLDQLLRLQRDDGALAFAYDVRTGAGSGQIRSNALAWAGIAAVAYRDRYKSSRYDALVAGPARYLLDARRPDGLVPGGPDVKWVSTQHNILAAELFRAAAAEYGNRPIGRGVTGSALATAAAGTGNAVVSKLLVQQSGSTYFVQGLDDARIPLDVQTLGSVFLRTRNDARATAVAAFLQANHYQAPRFVNRVLWSGYRPFAGSAAPNVIWSEGTVQADWALDRIGAAGGLADLAVLAILSTAGDGSSGPLGADRTVIDRAWGEFPGWPTSAAGSWLLIQGAGGDVLFS